MASAAFERLRGRVSAEYRGKGFSPARADYIARSVAGQQAHRKWSRTGHVPAEVRRQRSCVAAGMRGRRFGSRAAQRAAFRAIVRRCSARAR